MSTIKTLTDRYGPLWHIDPPPFQTPLVIDGRIDITDPSGIKLPIPVIRLKKESAGAAIVKVIQRIETKFFEFDSQTKQYTNLDPFVETGRFSYLFRLDDSDLPFSSQFLRNDGFAGYDANPNITGKSIQGLSNAGSLNLTRTPIIIPPDRTFGLVLQHHYEHNQQPIPQDTRRVFQARIIGFYLAVPSQ